MNAVIPQAVPDTAVRPEDRTHADEQTPALWSVGLLGGLDLSDGSQHLTRLPSRAVTALLARLALAPERAHAREELIELLWPGVALGVGRNRLRQALSTLKGVLEPAGRVPPQPVLLADRVSVRVAPGGLGCDALRFERLARAGRHTAARALYRGELLPGFYDDWIDEERLRLAALHDRLASGPETPAAAVATTAAPASGGARIFLPTYLTRVFGADEQAARLRGLVLTHRLVTLLGPGGSGKTRLAVEMAHSLRTDAGWPVPSAEAFAAFDLIAFVPLAACSTRAQACDALTSALQIAPRADDPLLGLTDALAGRRALLLLDNFEQLVGQAQDLVAHLTGLLPLLHVVVTSRRALGLDGEHELAVAALELPAADADAGSAAGNPAIALFVERARAVRADFHFSSRNGAALVALVRALDGMPLAIELAASRVRSIAPADMLARLRSAGTPRLDLLARSGPRGALDSRHASMQRVIEWSWELLGAPQARLLAALTVFPDGFTAASAAALVSDEALDAQLLLDELVSHSLVHAQAGSDETLRFGLYPPIREFAAAQADAGTTLHWRTRLRTWAHAWAQALPCTPPLDAVRTELPNLMAAMSSAVADQVPDDAIRLALSLRRVLEDVELPADSLTMVAHAVDGCADASLRSQGHTLLGPLLFLAGRADDAMRHAELGLTDAPPGAAWRGLALYTVARVRWRERRGLQHMGKLLEEAERLANNTNDLALQADLCTLRGLIANRARDTLGGQTLHALALSIWERLDNQLAVNKSRYNLAVSAQIAGRQQEVLDRLADLEPRLRALNDWGGLSRMLNTRGNAQSGLHQWTEAVMTYRECIRIGWHCMALHELVYGLWNLPRALAHIRDAERAVELAGFAAHLWETRFGVLDASDHHYLRLVRRLALCQMPLRRYEEVMQRGQHLPLADAVALALSA